ncbi:PilZ domain-containing protein [Amphritea atlantica]|uniref:PilZ domain-containing protein n=1 Tax=Amphritea atlantica TaxID=355243 RepID=A0A1H9I2G8_9GAMM|nr:PilZ domain-containing protein [Amphritea atlantica]SEQ68821.1 PilZ domain-containing protein [Amphritea atlantica]
MNQERRQYFRINGKVAVDYKVITEDEMQHGRLPTQFQVSPFFLLLTQLQEFSQDNSYQLRKIAQKDPLVATYLENMNNKIDAIAHAIAKSDVEFENLTTQEINLSEGGMSFYSKEPIPLKSYLALKVVFEETYSGLLLYGQVLYSGEKNEQGQYKIGIEFSDMPESSRMIVARYILTSQTRERQQNDEQY